VDRGFAAQVVIDLNLPDSSFVDALVATFNKIRDRHGRCSSRAPGPPAPATPRFIVMAKGEVIDRGRTQDIDSEQHSEALAF